MLRFKDKDGTVFDLPIVVRQDLVSTTSNARPRYDAAGNMDIDKQWMKMVQTYSVVIDRTMRDALWTLWKGTCPILTTSGSTPSFHFWDDTMLSRTGFVACTFEDVEMPQATRLPGDQEAYRMTFSLRFSGSDYVSKRLTA